MAEEEEQESQHPIAPATGHTRSSDAEAAPADEARRGALRNNKRRNCLLFIVLFIIFHTAIITLFSLTVMKVRTPKFRVREAAFTSFNAGTPANPAINARINAVLSIRNPNFGRYKYRNATVVFMYRGAPVGEAVVPDSRANWRSTEKLNVEAELNLGNGRMDAELSSDLKAGIVPITSQGKLRGRVELIFVMKKKKSSDMNCSMEIVTETQHIRNIFCR